MRIGDQLLLSLITSKPQVNLSNIMMLICDYLEENNTYPIKRLIGYLLSDSDKIRRPPGCIQIIYKGVPYWRDGWNNLYHNRTCKKAGTYYPQTDWASVENV
jgi:hypothetical protein